MADQGMLSGNSTPESYLLWQMLQAMGQGRGGGHSAQPIQNASPQLPNRQGPGAQVPYMPAFPGANPAPLQLAQLLGGGSGGSSAGGGKGGGKGGSGNSQGLLSGLFSGKGGGGINANVPYNAIDSSAAGVFNMSAGDAAASGASSLGVGAADYANILSEFAGAGF